MTARRPLDEPLVGRFVSLTPMTPADFAELGGAIAKPEVFAGGYGGGAAGLPRDADEWERFAAASYAIAADALPFAVRVRGGVGDGTIVGATKLGELDVVHESAHLGWTAYDPRVWGTVVNPEVKLLVLGLAFGHGFGRIRIQADAINARSRAAIEKLGAHFEGIQRRARRRADGSWRDTAVYSILADEWPAVRAGLEGRVASWDGGPLVLPAE